MGSDADLLQDHLKFNMLEDLVQLLECMRHWGKRGRRQSSLAQRLIHKKNSRGSRRDSDISAVEPRLTQEQLSKHHDWSDSERVRRSSTVLAKRRSSTSPLARSLTISLAPKLRPEL